MKRRLAALLAGLLSLSVAAHADMYQDASNSKTDTVFRFGTGLYPVYAQAAATTATTTIGLNTITVANPTGIVIGDLIYGPSFVAWAWVTNIAGSTITMSSPATSTQTGASVTFGIDRYEPGKTVFSDILGVRRGYFGVAARGHSTWVAKYWAGADYPSQNTLFSISEQGTQAGMFATRASESTGGTDASVIGLGTLVVHDGDAFRSSWNQYSESRLTSSIAGQHIQTESTIVNEAWATAEFDPYKSNGTGGSVNYRLDCGAASVGGGLECSSPLQINNIGAAYKAGIIVGDTSITPVSGLSSALQLPRNYGIDWFVPHAPGELGGKAWRLYSSASPANGTSSINLGEQGVITQTADPGTSGSPRVKYQGSGNAMTVGLESDFNAVVSLSAGTPFYIKQNEVVHLVVNGGITSVKGLVVSTMATSCAGGVTGMLWNDAGTVKVCP